jgi:hypothetical protein
MAIAFVQEFEVEPSDRSTTNYDAVKERLNVEADPPAGLIVHTAGFTGTGLFRIFDVWASEQDLQRFHNERLMPIVEAEISETDLAAGPPAQHTYELRDLVKV